MRRSKCSATSKSGMGRIGRSYSAMVRSYSSSNYRALSVVARHNAWCSLSTRSGPLSAIKSLSGEYL